MAKEKITSCAKFDDILLQILTKHAPLKSKLLRANHASNIPKPLRKAIMKKAYLEYLHFKNRTEHSLRNYKKTKTKKLLQQTLHFDKLNTSFVSDNNYFGKP